MTWFLTVLVISSHSHMHTIYTSTAPLNTESDCRFAAILIDEHFKDSKTVAHSSCTRFDPRTLREH